jgi:Zn-dependent protease
MGPENLQSLRRGPTLPVAMTNFSPETLMIGFISYLVFLFSTTCHEAAHAFVAARGGDQTAAMGGQVTLNPIPHIRREPFGMVVIPLLSFLFGGGMIGWASAPYDPLWERRYPKRAGWMALAGPATNFTLMLLAVVAIRAAKYFDVFQEPNFSGPMGFLSMTLLIVFTLNLLLGTFNLLPVPPLDGSAGIMVFMSESRAQSYLAWLRGNNFAIAGLLVGLVVFQRIFPYVRDFVENLLL